MKVQVLQTFQANNNETIVGTTIGATLSMDASTIPEILPGPDLWYRTVGNRIRLR